MNAAPASQTLSRGLSILEQLSEHSPLSIDEIAAGLNVHRSVAYRLVRTLEHHRLVIRDAAGLCVLGPQMTVLAAGVNRDLQSVAAAEVNALAHELELTCFFGMLDGDDFVTLVSAAPRIAGATLAQRPGSRHPITVGAPSKAVLAGMPDAAWPVDVEDALLSDVQLARERGWAESHDEVIPTVTSLAVSLPVVGGVRSALAVLAMQALPRPEEIAQRLHDSSHRIASQLGAGH
ncbi:MAG TPA: helix-turn-helix domain-containing protein [Candidatus Agrococcus pullicola]|uniref:Helix-turn-helix domain-containing protein n=1 Tax=Candidatus Agrococcus pullicola TaxID=2838429 RepID=A0A9D1YWN4_9MICO|nr:helix-turn-helix domain-containing protein [Candidatus Agrococcus pullicola]